MYDIIIVGAGPAGLTSAIFARRANKKVLVLEANIYGGQIINALNIENYPGLEHITGSQFVNNLYNQVINLKVELLYEKVVSIKVLENIKQVVTNHNTYDTKSVIIATGSNKRKLNLPGEKELLGKGVSYCATCDGAFYKNKDVAVVGGGNTALEDALYLSDIVNKVYLIHRRNNFSGSDILIKQIKEKKNIEILYESQIISINGIDKLESITVKDKNGILKEYLVSGLFIAIGLIPENNNMRDIIKIDDNGYIIAGEDCHTNIAGIFVAGDIREKKLRQLVTATSDGAVAATEAIKYINN